MIQLSIKMLPVSGSNQYAYNFADLLVQVKMGREFKLMNDYSFMVFSESLVYMAGESTWHKCHWHHAWLAGRTYSMTMLGVTVWMPGKYFFLMAPKDEGRVIRFDLELDDRCRFTVGEPRWCERQSVEGVLAYQGFDVASPWNPLFTCAGFAQLERPELDEVVHGFFCHPDLSGYEFTPAAVDKVCRLLKKNAQRGLIHLCSKHYYAAIVFNGMAGRCGWDNEFVVDVDDIDEDKFLD